MTRSSTLVPLLAFTLPFSLAACGSDSTNPAGTGGTAGRADAGDDVGGGGSSGASGSSAGGDSGGGSAGAAGFAVPMIDGALEGNCPGGNPPGTGVSPGNDLHKTTLSGYANALCNDGTPGIMFVRASSTAAAAGRWVIHMQAGGSCNRYGVCVDRWCSNNTSYDAAKMSSSFAPEVANGSGVFSRNTNNAFGSANQVYLYYCSSDSWLGRRSDFVMEDPDGTHPPYRLHFRGFSILEAAADALKKGVTSDDGAETLPSLSDATEVLFSGSSAGANGLTSSLDWWASQVPNAKVGGVFDSIFHPLTEDVADPTVAASYLAQQKLVYTAQKEIYDAHLDDTCVAAHTADDAYLCSSTGHVRLNHITTPYFARQDLTDPVQYNFFAVSGGTMQQFSDAVLKTMKRVADVGSTAEEKADITVAPGAHVSNCGQHIVMLNSPWFGVAANGNATVEAPNGTALTVHDALGAWATGTPINAIDTLPSTISVCAATTSDQ